MAGRPIASSSCAVRVGLTSSSFFCWNISVPLDRPSSDQAAARKIPLPTHPASSSSPASASRSAVVLLRTRHEGRACLLARRSRDGFGNAPSTAETPASYLRSLPTGALPTRSAMLSDGVVGPPSCLSPGSAFRRSTPFRVGVIPPPPHLSTSHPCQLSCTLVCACVILSLRWLVASTDLDISKSPDLTGRILEKRVKEGDPDPCPSPRRDEHAPETTVRGSRTYLTAPGEPHLLILRARLDKLPASHRR